MCQKKIKILNWFMKKNEQEELHTEIMFLFFFIIIILWEKRKFNIIDWLSALLITHSIQFIIIIIIIIISKQNAFLNSF